MRIIHRVTTVTALAVPLSLGLSGIAATQAGAAAEQRPADSIVDVDVLNERIPGQANDARDTLIDVDALNETERSSEQRDSDETLDLNLLGEDGFALDRDEQTENDGLIDDLI